MSATLSITSTTAHFCIVRINSPVHMYISYMHKKIDMAITQHSNVPCQFCDVWNQSSGSKVFTTEMSSRVSDARFASSAILIYRSLLSELATALTWVYLSSPLSKLRLNIFLNLCRWFILTSFIEGFFKTAITIKSAEFCVKSMKIKGSLYKKLHQYKV